jgi:uncharacterized membrane protein
MMKGPFTLGHLHLILLHFPIVWISTAFLCDLIYLFKRQPVLMKISDWLVIGAALIAIPTVLTGAVLAGADITDPELLYHRNWALTTLAFTLLHALFRFYSLAKEKTNPNYIILSAINLGLIGITADFGGLVAFGVGFLI